MKTQFGFSYAEIMILLVWVAAICGWIANVVKLFGLVDGPVTTIFILRVVGIFVAPLGAFLGFF